MTFLAIPVESRNSWTLKSDATVGLVVTAVMAPERVRRSIRQV